MRSGSGLILIVIALFIGFLAVTGKYRCFPLFWTCIGLPLGGEASCSCGGGGGGSPIIVPPGGVDATGGSASAPPIFDTTRFASIEALPPLRLL